MPTLRMLFQVTRALLPANSSHLSRSLPAHQKQACPNNPDRARHTPARARTVDKLIKSQLLYQLSYGGFCGLRTRNVTRRPLWNGRAAGQIRTDDPRITNALLYH